MRRILCLYLPDWPIQRLLAARNRRVGPASGARAGPPISTPILLHARDPRRGDLVVVCNAAACQRGVRLEMPLAEAAALAEHGGECLILPHDPAADLAALARLAEHCERFSPIVGWQTVQGPRSGHPRSGSIQSPKSSADLGPWTLDFGLSPGPDCLFLDITGIGVLFGGEENLAQELIADLARLGYEARVVLADTIGAAWASAKQAEPDIQVLRGCERIGTRSHRLWPFRGGYTTCCASTLKDSQPLSTEYNQACWASHS